MEKDQEIASLAHKLSIVDGELESAEKKLADSKALQEEGEHSKSTNEGLVRKIQLLEEELDAAEKNVKETMEKYVAAYDSVPHRANVDVGKTDCGKLMSRLNISNAKYSVLSRNVICGRRNTRYKGFFPYLWTRR